MAAIDRTNNATFFIFNMWRIKKMKSQKESHPSPFFYPFAK
jgi:hypothetical protein